MPAQSTMTSPQQLIEIAKAPLIAYNDKKWDAAKNAITTDFVYDEIATRRKVQGADQTLEIWRGWATAFPDSRATFHGAFASGNTVVFEVTWNGTHQGALQTPTGSIAPSGRRIEIRACCVVEVAGEKAKLQRHYFDMLTLLEQLGVKP
ncbi:MAG TPA: ester cyclase [Gemmatimonadales bacterium]|nr:ester cyclase [Gemmatimonadales bacterium]